MKYLRAFLVVLVLIKTSLGDIPKPRRFKPTTNPQSSHSQPKPDGSLRIRSRVDYEHKPRKHVDSGPYEPQPGRNRGYRLESYPEDEPIYGARRANDSQSAKNELSGSSDPSYRTPSHYVPSGASPDSDSSYIPHSKSFAKYFDSRPGSKLRLDKNFYLGDVEEDGGVPKYAFLKKQKEDDHDGKAAQHKPLDHLEEDSEKKYPTEHGPEFKFESDLRGIVGHSDRGETRKEPGYDDAQITKAVIRNYGPSYVPDIAVKKLIDGLHDANRPSGYSASHFNKVPINLAASGHGLSHIPEEFHLKYAGQDHHDKPFNGRHYPEITRDKRKNHPVRSQYPLLLKYNQQEQNRAFRYLQPDLKFDYDSVLKPRARFYEDLKKDLDQRMQLLKEHEEKTVQLQKQHLEKYRAFFNP